MEILYQGKKYNAYPSDHFAVEEAVCVNGIYLLFYLLIFAY